MDRVIELRAVVSVLGRFPALAGLDLDVRRGEIVLLAGPNGAGKTTLLRVCAALSGIASGRACVLGHELPAQRRAVRRQVGFLGHTNGLYDDLTVRENVRFWARAAAAPATDVDGALDRLRVEPRLRNMAVAGLSAGQRRRVALAALLVRRPELWLLDEPHAGLDATSRDDLDELVVEAVAGGATVLFASHETERGSALAGRVVTLVGGVVAADSGPALPGPPSAPMFADGPPPGPMVADAAPPVAPGTAGGDPGPSGLRGRLSGRRAGVA